MCASIGRITRGWTWTTSQLLKSAQLYQPDPESGRDGVTLAGVMLFGTDSQILQVCPAHRTDLILRKVNVDRYDDRDLVRTNLIDSYDRILAFIRKHLPDPFYLEGTRAQESSRSDLPGSRLQHADSQGVCQRRTRSPHHRIREGDHLQRQPAARFRRP